MMQRRQGAIVAISLCGALVAAMASTGLGEKFTDIAIQGTREHQVRFTSDKTIYVEMLLGDRWVGRYWSADDRLDPRRPRFTEPAFEIQMKDDPAAAAKDLTAGWRWIGAEELPKTDRSARHFVVKLSHKSFPVNVALHTLLDGTPVLTRWLDITNTSSKPVALMAVSPWSSELWADPGHDYPAEALTHAFDLGYFTRDDWTYEGWFQWKPLLPNSTTLVKCDTGRGNNDPFFVVHNEAMGEYFIGHLAWSANWVLEFGRDDAGPSFRCGPAGAAALRVIAPGETITTPAVHLGHVSGDLDSAVQAMHDHLRRFVLPTRKPERSYLIQYLTPNDIGYAQYMGDAYNEANIFRVIDVAAALGVELFILDGPGWYDVQLDWVPSPSRFPRGLEPIIDYVHRKGMLFGLFAETEGGRGNVGASTVAREHPDWITPYNTINLAKPEAAAWMESEICRLVEQYHPDLFRLAYEASPTSTETPRGDFMEDDWWRYYEAFYSMCERIHKKYPDLILQQCSAGGARNDLGTASRFHEQYLTDGLWTPRVFQVYSGETLALPPEVFVTACGIFASFGSPDPVNLDTYLRSTFTLSTPMYFYAMVAPPEGIAQLSPERRERYLYYADLYKKFIRSLLPTCKVYHHAPVNASGGVESGPWFAMEFMAPDRSRGWATIIRIGKSDTDIYVFRPRGLDGRKTYRVTFGNTGKTALFEGSRLMRNGLPIEIAEPVGPVAAVLNRDLPSSELLLFEAQ